MLQAKKEYEEKIRREELSRIEREREIADLEQKEMELIERLQHTQSVQKQAYEELEKVLASSPEELSHRPPSSLSGHKGTRKK